MFKRHICAVSILFVVIFVNSTFAADPNVIAEFTDLDTDKVQKIVGGYDVNEMRAQQFDVATDAAINEIALCMYHLPGTVSGSVVVKLCPNESTIVFGGYSYPNLPNALAQKTVPVSSLSENKSWVSFEFASPVNVSAGKYWIVWSLTSGASGEVCSSIKLGNHVNGIDDTRLCTGSSEWWAWSMTGAMLNHDMNFRVLGGRVQETTSTRVSAPATGVTSTRYEVTVDVNDSSNEPLIGWAPITLEAPDGGTFDNSSLTLEYGDANTVWKSPSTSGWYEIKAQFDAYTPDGSGVDYGDSNDSVMIYISPQNRWTSTRQTVDNTYIRTRETIDVNVIVIDSCNVAVGDGEVTFCTLPKSGSFSPNPVSVDSLGRAETTWLAGDGVGDFNIVASYSCAPGASIIYGGSDDSDVVSVDYMDVNTTTTIEVSPGYPYVGFEPYVIIKVRDQWGNLVPGGSVQLPTTIPAYGTFRATNINLMGGMCYTKWGIPSSLPISNPVTVSAIYQDGYTAGGKRYKTSLGNTTAKIIKDSDSGGSGELSWMIEWITSYPWPEDDLKNTDDDAKGFKDTLQGYTGREFSNSNAWEDHMKGNIFGQEEDFMDVHDVTYFSGHGGKDILEFATWHDNLYLNHDDSYDDWGDKDAEWAMFAACHTMSHASYWASTMDGLHLICGFITEMGDSAKHGRIFGNFLRKQNVWDSPHRISQSWFLASNQSQSAEKKMRVVGENEAMFADYIWSHGYVSDDPSPNNSHHTVTYDVNKPTWPTANAGSYTTNAIVGVPFQLNGSGTTGLSFGSEVFFVWDMDTSVDTDPNDWDNAYGNGNDDDGDAWGVRPQWVFTTAKNYTIRLMVIDDDWHVNSSTASVTVVDPPMGMINDMEKKSTSSGGVVIIDAYDANNLPTEWWMQTYSMSDDSNNFEEMINVGDSVQMDSSIFGTDELGNYTTFDGDNELIVNAHSGGVMYINKAKAFIEPNTLPMTMPPNPVGIASDFLSGHGVNPMNSVLSRAINICAEDANDDSRKVTSRTPFQTLVEYQRQLESMGSYYPVVGPGGKMSVLVDSDESVVMYMKSCRELDMAGEVELSYRPDQAVIDFHSLGTEALLPDYRLPAGCERIRIDDVSIGYYESDFVTYQASVLPVYIFDVTCETDKGALRSQLYMSAIRAPMDIDIQSPLPDTQVNYGDPVTFAGTVLSGGSAPYTYRWESDVKGLLSTDYEFTTSSLLVNYQSSDGICENLPHTISFTVTDDYGFETTEYVKITVEGLCSDFDRDGDVDFEDFAEFALSWLVGPGQAGYNEKTDFDKNNVTNASDLYIFTDEWLSGQ
ncbi:MAG: hypothetical protein JW806_00380 [Sedimentisphaerales bacterium]|nr:hypothetical protein [Sedimentisphaerales bacterium]